ncbi:hypothetical protein F4703DRAFT_1794287 [Phycomyces blakesleeanus]
MSEFDSDNKANQQPIFQLHRELIKVSSQKNLAFFFFQKLHLSIYLFSDEGLRHASILQIEIWTNFPNFEKILVLKKATLGLFQMSVVKYSNFINVSIFLVSSEYLTTLLLPLVSRFKQAVGLYLCL